MTETLLISLLLTGIAVVGLSIGILLRKGGKFPDTHVGHNPNMKKLGIGCSQDESCLCRGLEKKKKQASPARAGHILFTRGGAPRCPGDRLTLGESGKKG